MTASGSRPCAAAQSSDASTRAAAPSFTPGAFPAVVAPSFEKTGGSAARRSADVSRRGPSSVSTMVSPRRPWIVTGTISSASRPASIAAIARSWLRSAHASCWARVMPTSADTTEFCSAMIRPSKVQVRPSEVIESTSDAVAERVPEPGLGQQVGGVGHALHAAGDDHVVLAGADQDVGQRRRPHSRCAHLVDRLGADRGPEADADGHLAGGDLARPGLQHLAHDHVADVGRGDAGALEGRAGGGNAEPGSGQRGQAPAQLSEGCAGGAEDDGAGQLTILSDLTTGRRCSIVKAEMTTCGTWWWRCVRGAAR